MSPTWTCLGACAWVWSDLFEMQIVPATLPSPLEHPWVALPCLQEKIPSPLECDTISSVVWQRLVSTVTKTQVLPILPNVHRLALTHPHLYSPKSREQWCSSLWKSTFALFSSPPASSSCTCLSPSPSPTSETENFESWHISYSSCLALCLTHNSGFMNLCSRTEYAWSINTLGAGSMTVCFGDCLSKVLNYWPKASSSSTGKQRLAWYQVFPAASSGIISLLLKGQVRQETMTSPLSHGATLKFVFLPGHPLLSSLLKQIIFSINFSSKSSNQQALVNEKFTF